MASTGVLGHHTQLPVTYSATSQGKETAEPLFHKSMTVRNPCPDSESCKVVFPNLVEAIPASLHVTVIFFCVVLICFSSVATGFFMYNAFGSPYETLHGPLGLYLWNFVCCFCSCLVMILFASEVKLHRLSDHIANFNEGTFVYKTHTEQFDHSFWLIFLTFLIHGLNILLIRVAGIQFPFQEAKESDVNTGASDLMY
ncbi:clarin-1 isoform X2 [Salvelinus sp. IW2-2015]|uniref:clarin-1 isoform X2 n=1 Tax=Salvelinus sp. IW2-2015 TaxID=2691554 RepID=UPI000CDFC8BC|nr:clarin-1 isoform X2 [Salvelinus alpinus]XP_023822471.1 clarin-1 isoform X2 [Salvelinus alpinus]XP_023822472.1 clarin-1 isoform X2 [Salvelinus alpinus]XP_023822473.1 clarin-1 isoform X2 [Salvelinus alpinus]XP_023822475.1 clarin-1 isoform X2 [Salvelinus alpinus]XP_023822476.1 clarin-1 isoform X2 [Salvelinus alpinus]